MNSYICYGITIDGPHFWILTKFKEN